MGSYISQVIYQEEITATRRSAKRRTLGRAIEPARTIPIRDSVDVLVVGAGPAGTTAAIAAARLGANVLLVERYNHLGGLSTGGLVIWIDRMTDWQGELVIRGIGAELLDRLPADAKRGPERSIWGSRDTAHVTFWKPRFSAHHNVVTRAPMIDPEALKAVSLAAVRESGARLLLHAWASKAVIEEGKITGVIFESKGGRFVVNARVVVDTTGDGDVFASAGEVTEGDVDSTGIHQCINTAWLVGGVDCDAWLQYRCSPDYAAFAERGRSELGLFEWPIASWRNDVAVFMGPRWAGYDGLNPDDLTAVELRSRDKMAEIVAFYRAHAPGFSNAWVLLTAPQIGVRQTRRLKGRGVVARADWEVGRIHADEVGVSPSLAPRWGSVSVPYSALLPQSTRGLIVAGRHLSSDTSTHSFMREIPQCWLTGHAAGVGAALAAAANGDPANLPIADLQKGLLAQGAWLRQTPEVAGRAAEAVQQLS